MAAGADVSASCRRIDQAGRCPLPAIDLPQVTNQQGAGHAPGWLMRWHGEGLEQRGVERVREAGQVAALAHHRVGVGPERESKGEGLA